LADRAWSIVRRLPFALRRQIGKMLHGLSSGRASAALKLSNPLIRYLGSPGRVRGQIQRISYTLQQDRLESVYFAIISLAGGLNLLSHMRHPVWSQTCEV